MEQHEQDLQRFMQIREEIHQEIEKIPPLVLQLQEMTYRFQGHFKVFENLSQNTQGLLKATIKNASFEMAELAAEELSKKLEDQTQNILENLAESVHEAKAVFDSASKKNMIKVVSIMSLLILLSFSIGFGLGEHYYEKRSYNVVREFLQSTR